ncbi:hypothetical protein C453_15878 [Haloferax elongans ATCC BAA-1513]|uniref:Uncharacterized protein n=1 Tax=Haloferax elongans ATCC BAA-1513 TaxID=1230453 RepID=M0HHM1_HALEO|nr:hypothetical protein [Haloferax elongans]ELZ82579.1 hypothetical protein C453_15878 [Haloferax elongans ATCC BAA-1513]
MENASRRSVVGLSALAFAVCFGALTALRELQAAPPTSVQSLVVDVALLLLVAAIAYFVYRGGGAIESWILALGPSLAFAFNLFIPVSAMESIMWVLYPLGSGVLISVLLGGMGFGVGYAGRTLRKAQGVVESS